MKNKCNIDMLDKMLREGWHERWSPEDYERWFKATQRMRRD